MSLADDIREEVQEILNTNWKERDGEKVPEAEEVKLGNDAVKLAGTVLYADLAESTAMVKDYENWFAAEMYKAFLLSACRIIRDEGGAITAFDGDRVMAVYIGHGKNSAAARTGLKINHAVLKIINDEVASKYEKNPFQLKHAVGIDTSDVFVARTGVRGANDLVWVGRAANYAAKLCSLRSGSYATWITDTVYASLNKDAKYGANGSCMWDEKKWGEFDMTVYASSWIWTP
jgi:class 3 adenylate cyclase